MKKTLKIVLAGLLCLAVLGGVVSYLCRDRIAAKAKALLSEYIRADVTVGGVRLHLLRTFPDAGISLRDVTVTGYEPFAGDTLLAFRDLTLQVDLKSLLHPEQMT
ncbi:MAG: hypothetical protein J6X20_02040, partial [Bacteroidales bacterium]|nr:hypothetical protein [Bacteroidales bacterium]